MEQFELAINTQDEQIHQQPRPAFWDKIANFTGCVAATAPISAMAIAINVNKSPVLHELGTTGLKAAVVGAGVCAVAILRGNRTAR